MVKVFWALNVCFEDLEVIQKLAPGSVGWVVLKSVSVERKFHPLCWLCVEQLEARVLTKNTAKKNQWRSSKFSFLCPLYDGELWQCPCECSRWFGGDAKAFIWCADEKGTNLHGKKVFRYLESEHCLSFSVWEHPRARFKEQTLLLGQVKWLSHSCHVPTWEGPSCCAVAFAGWREMGLAEAQTSL